MIKIFHMINQGCSLKRNSELPKLPVTESCMTTFSLHDQTNKTGLHENSTADEARHMTAEGLTCATGDRK